MTPRRRPRVRKAQVTCPECGEKRWVQVWPALWVLGMRVERGTLLTVGCARHCGGNVPITVSDVRRAA